MVAAKGAYHIEYRRTENRKASDNRPTFYIFSYQNTKGINFIRVSVALTMCFFLMLFLGLLVFFALREMLLFGCKYMYAGDFKEIFRVLLVVQEFLSKFTTQNFNIFILDPAFIAINWANTPLSNSNPTKKIGLLYNPFKHSVENVLHCESLPCSEYDHPIRSRKSFKKLSANKLH